MNGGAYARPDTVFQRIEGGSNERAPPQERLIECCVL